MSAGPGHQAVEWLSAAGFDLGLAEKFLLGVVDEPVCEDHQQFAGLLCIPNLIVDQYGVRRPVGLKFRRLDHEGKTDSRPKFIQPPGQQSRLYNLQALATATDTIVVTEGESDCWAATMAGFHAVAAPGANAWGKRAAARQRMLEGFERVVLCRDNDDAGSQLVKAMESLPGLIVRSFAPHKDVHAFLQAEGAVSLTLQIDGVL